MPFSNGLDKKLNQLKNEKLVLLKKLKEDKQTKQLHQIKMMLQEYHKVIKLL